MNTQNIINIIKNKTARYHLDDSLGIHSCHDSRCKRDHFSTRDDAMDAGESIAESKATPLPPLTKRTE
ncbi:hypothetical protein [Bifidobacterium aquikefiri]|uniref:hypothetical protein n=1 Tax=Bifidobacterium aquikefiri TaxID=1653207 RepID=UPI0039E8711C